MAEIKMNYGSNSHKKRTETKKQETPDREKLSRVTSRPAQQRKPGIFSRMRMAIGGEDSGSIGQFILYDIVVPTVKGLIVEVVSQGAERTFYGDGARRSSGTRTGYNKVSREPSYRSEPRSMSSRGRATHDFREVVLASRAEAEEVIDRMYYMIDKYDVVTVNDVYDLVGISGDFTDDKYGWGDLPYARPKRVRDGYLLDIPRPEPID